MARITPYTLSDLEDIDDHTLVHVDWTVVQPFASDTHVRTSGTIASLRGDHGDFVSSVISCRHPDGGKFWESVFIPLQMTGGKGVSLTRWGKKATRGQMQAKLVSEHEWYKTVKSKAVAGGYDVLNFVGREIPLATDHSFIKILHERIEVATLPAFGFSSNQKSVIGRAAGAEGLGYVMGKAMSNIIPSENFFRNMIECGHNVRDALLHAVKELPKPEEDLIYGFVRGMNEHINPNIPQVSKNGFQRPPEPQIDRDEVYGGGWGAFG